MADFNVHELKGYATKAIHCGQDPKQWKHLAIVPPIVTSATFYQGDPMEVKEFQYSREGNPTRDVLERCLASLDNGQYGLAFSSGHGAMSAVTQLLNVGDHIVCCDETYGGTYSLFTNFIAKQGINVDFVDGTNLELMNAAIRNNTKLIWIESPSNPCLKVVDIRAIANLAHGRGESKILVAVDNTFLTSFYQRPLDLGADIVMYSLSKYMNGHSDVVMGALIVNDATLNKQLRFIQMELGSVPSAFDCYLVNRGLKTLPIRMLQHSKSSLTIAKFLKGHPKIVKVMHPGLPSHPQHNIALKQSFGHSGMIAFQLSGSIEESRKFLMNLKVFTSAASLGSCESLAELPVCSSHIGVPKEFRDRLGIFDTVIRLSVGLEDIDDLIKDLGRALRLTYE